MDYTHQINLFFLYIIVFCVCILSTCTGLKMYKQPDFPSSAAVRAADLAQTNRRVPASRNLDRLVTQPRYTPLPILFKCNGKLGEFNQTTVQISQLDLPPSPALYVRPVSAQTLSSRIPVTQEEKINFQGADPSVVDAPNVLVPWGGAVLATRGLVQGTFRETGAKDEFFNWSFKDTKLLDYDSNEGTYALFAQEVTEKTVFAHDSLNFFFEWTLNVPAVIAYSNNPTVEVTFELTPNPYWSRTPTDANVTYEPR